MYAKRHMLVILAAILTAVTFLSGIMYLCIVKFTPVACPLGGGTGGAGGGPIIPPKIPLKDCGPCNKWIATKMKDMPSTFNLTTASNVPLCSPCTPAHTVSKTANGITVTQDGVKFIPVETEAEAIDMMSFWAPGQ